MKKPVVPKPPVWFILVLLFTLLPTLLWPLIMIRYGRHAADSGNWVLLILYPIYAVISIYLAYRCYADQQGISWILIILTWLSLGAELLLI